MIEAMKVVTLNEMVVRLRGETWTMLHEKAISGSNQAGFEPIFWSVV